MTHDNTFFTGLSLCWRRRLSILATLAICTLTSGGQLFGQRDLKDIPDPDPELERRSLELAEGFEVQLFASDPLLAKPIQMNFDARGRLWVASSSVYPQIEPGQVPNDKVLILDDTDGDGTADRTTVFAQGLLIPTGVLPDATGCYVANSTELLHLSDTDGDGRADREQVVLSGFGTEDTHHILHTLRWGPDGHMYMNQSIYIHSHIETPYGVRRMNGSGVWRFRPESLRLDVFTLGLVNPWGHAWDRYGTSFETDGAGGEGINYVFPGFVGLTSPGAKRIVHGLNPGKPKLCGLEVVGGTHLPPAWEGNLITNDFRAHRVCRYVVSEEGSGFQAQELGELVRTRHVAFRPVDVKMGPDGAIYIADWYNPIIQHGEVDFRDPRRDHIHGRIWRIKAKGRALLPRLDLTQLDTESLIDLLVSPEPWRRQQARAVLKHRGKASVLPPLRLVLQQRETGESESDALLRLEALWLHEAWNVVEPDLLQRLLNAPDHRLRAAATRIAGYWADRLADPLAVLQPRVVDDHPRVRLEAVRALAHLRDPRACPTAMQALNLPVDGFLDFCLWRTARDLQPYWLPALQRGEIDFAGNIDHLTFALRAIETQDIAPLLVSLLASDRLNPQRRLVVLEGIAQTGDAKQLQLVLADLPKIASAADQANLLERMVGSTRQRRVIPAGRQPVIFSWINTPPRDRQLAAIRAAGAWKWVDAMGPLLTVANDHQQSPEVRRAAIDAIAEFATPEALEALLMVDNDPAIGLYAAAATMDFQPREGAIRLAERLAAVAADTDPSAAIERALQRRGAEDSLAAALAQTRIARDVAMRAIRQVESTGRPLTELLAGLRAAGKLDQPAWQLSPQDREQLLREVKARGNPVRGEALYRSERLECQKCHAIAGVGGVVGPDLASIGASAQPDYLLQSLLEPSAKIKENYHSLIVETDRGQVLTGIKLGQTDEALLLRDAQGRELTIPLDSIEEQTDGGSLMPRGVVDLLTRDELIDLVRFLSELGKVGRVEQ